MGMPNIVINFIKNAQTVRQRSEQGVVCLVLKDATSVGATVTKMTHDTDIDTSKWTAENQKLIKLAFMGNPKTVFVVRYGSNGSFSDVADELPTIPFNWIACPSAQADQALCKTWLLAYNNGNPNHCRKAVLYNTAADDMHVVNFATTAVEFKDGVAFSGVSALGYVARIAGLLAGTPIDRAATYTIMDELTSCAEPEDKGTALGNGQLFLFNDEGDVRVARAINSLTTIGSQYTDAQKKIAVVEAMDLIRSDIGYEFKNNFVGKYKNNASNQALFVSFVNQYFDELADAGVLNSELENVAYIDVESQRKALIDSGYDAEDWDDETVKKHTVSDMVFLAGSVAILDAIENLQFNITMK